MKQVIATMARSSCIIDEVKRRELSNWTLSPFGTLGYTQLSPALTTATHCPPGAREGTQEPYRRGSTSPNAYVIIIIGNSQWEAS